MRILASLAGDAPPHSSELAALAAEHELVISHGAAADRCGRLRLALRNLLPDRDVVTVLTHVVLAGHLSSGGRGAEPRAIAELRSLRALIEAGSVVLCSLATGSVAVDGIGEMRRSEAKVDEDLASSLLARRLDADLFLLLGAGPGPASRSEAASRFAEATGRRAAIGSLAEAGSLVRGEAGTQVKRR